RGNDRQRCGGYGAYHQGTSCSIKDRVCSPAGTTIAGVAALEENGFRHSIIAATDKCYEKCTGLK
uniref:pyrroline-5-carboxylate reductase dimerization domain-containing protein n=1 Tax=Eshraghiella crossota TaxID=45851 RepID=UPI003FF08BD6